MICNNKIVNHLRDYNLFLHLIGLDFYIGISFTNNSKSYVMRITNF